MKHTKTSIAKSANGNGSAEPAHQSPGADLPLDGIPVLDEMVAVIAYFHAERRGFAPGNELADWFQAEAECKNRYSRNS
jgi:hypothetical protein